MLSDDLYNKIKEKEVELKICCTKADTEKIEKILKEILNIPLGYLIKEIKKSDFRDSFCKDAVKRTCNTWDFVANKLKKEGNLIILVGAFKEYLKRELNEIYIATYGD